MGSAPITILPPLPTPPSAQLHQMTSLSLLVLSLCGLVLGAPTLEEICTLRLAPHGEEAVYCVAQSDQLRGVVCVWEEGCEAQIARNCSAYAMGPCRFFLDPETAQACEWDGEKDVCSPSSDIIPTPPPGSASTSGSGEESNPAATDSSLTAGVLVLVGGLLCIGAGYAVFRNHQAHVVGTKPPEGSVQL